MVCLAMQMCKWDNTQTEKDEEVMVDSKFV